MDNPILEMRHVTVDIKSRKNILNIERLTLRKGELVAVVGPNGAGKSTLLQAINLLQPFRGEMSLFGQNVTRADKTQLRRRSALVFQEMLLLDGTVFYNVAQALKFRKMSADEVKEKVHASLLDFNCAHLADRPARLLSGGEKQRVCLARALVTGPEILLLDEPSASLDAAMRVDMIAKIRQIAEERGISVVLISHNFMDVLHLAERVLVLLEGRIVQDDKPEAIMRKPVDEQVARLVGMDNIIPCKIERSKQSSVVTLVNGVKFSVSEQVSGSEGSCCLSGDDLHLFDAGSMVQPNSAVLLEGIVERVMPDIGTYRILVRSGEQTFHVRLPRDHMTDDIHARAVIKLFFQPANAHFV